MNRKLKLMSLALAAALAVPALPALAQPLAAGPLFAASAVAPDPAQQLRELAQLFRAGDLAGFVQAAVPPDQWDALQTAYELAKLRPTEDEARHGFAEAVARITGPDAVDQLMAEIEPKLDEVRPQAPGAVQMALGGLQMAIASPEAELTDEQRAALAAALPGLQQWASSTDFLDAATLRRALTLVTDAARRTGIVDLEQLKAMSLVGLLDTASSVFVAGKDAVRLYGVDLDAMADSLQVEVVEMMGDTARVRTTVTLFGAPVWHEHDMVLVDGRWYGKEMLVQFRHGHRVTVEG